MRMPLPQEGWKNGDCSRCGARDVPITARYGDKQQILACRGCDEVLWHERVVKPALKLALVPSP